MFRTTVLFILEKFFYYSCLNSPLFVCFLLYLSCFRSQILYKCVCSRMFMFAYLSKNSLSIVKSIFASFLLIAFALVAYFFSSGLVRVLTIGVVSLVVFAYIVYKYSIFTTSETGSLIHHTWSEIVYSLLGIPILATAIFYLPISLYFVFAHGAVMILNLKITLITLIVIFQFISLLVFFLQIIRDRKVYSEDIFEIELDYPFEYDYIFSPAK